MRLKRDPLLFLSYAERARLERDREFTRRTEIVGRAADSGMHKPLGDKPELSAEVSAIRARFEAGASGREVFISAWRSSMPSSRWEVSLSAVTTRRDDTTLTHAWEHTRRSLLPSSPYRPSSFSPSVREPTAVAPDRGSIASRNRGEDYAVF